MRAGGGSHRLVVGDWKFEDWETDADVARDGGDMGMGNMSCAYGKLSGVGLKWLLKRFIVACYLTWWESRCKHDSIETGNLETGGLKGRNAFPQKGPLCFGVFRAQRSGTPSNETMSEDQKQFLRASPRRAQPINDMQIELVKSITIASNLCRVEICQGMQLLR